MVRPSIIRKVITIDWYSGTCQRLVSQSLSSLSLPSLSNPCSGKWRQAVSVQDPVRISFCNPFTPFFMHWFLIQHLWNEAQRNVRKKITMTRPFHPAVDLACMSVIPDGWEVNVLVVLGLRSRSLLIIKERSRHHKSLKRNRPRSLSQLDECSHGNRRRVKPLNAELGLTFFHFHIIEKKRKWKENYLQALEISDQIFFQSGFSRNIFSNLWFTSQKL